MPVTLQQSTADMQSSATPSTWDVSATCSVWRCVTESQTPKSSSAIVMRSQLRWPDHTHCIDDSPLPKRLLYGELSTGKRSLWKTKLWYKDTLKESLKQCGIPDATWEESAKDHLKWHFLIKSVVADFEEARIKDIEHLPIWISLAHPLSSLQ